MSLLWGCMELGRRKDAGEEGWRKDEGHWCAGEPEKCSVICLWAWGVWSAQFE